jgi:hypothetical protein
MAKLTVAQMVLLGAFSGIVIILVSMMNWRRAVHAALVVALLEGAIRKWIFPQGSEMVYFLKDIILFGAYIKFFIYPDDDVKASKLIFPGTLVACVTIALTVFGALNPNIGSLFLAVYGLKIYLFYIPLAFMVPLLFRNQEHMTKLLFNYSLMAIPICSLGVAQFFASPDSPINTYAMSDLAGVQSVASFGSGQEARARITGTFSYIGGHNVFVVVFFILSICLFTAVEGKKRLILLYGNLPLLLTNSLMTGSRGAVFSLLIIGAIIGLTSAVSQIGKKKNTFVYLVFGFAVAVGGTVIFFEKALKAFETRRKTAGDSVAVRVLWHPLASVSAASSRVDVVGYGIGTSHPAALGLRRAFKIDPIKRPAPYYDAELGQVLGELGWPAFILWYALRLTMLYQCWQAYKNAAPSIFRSLALGFFCYHLLLISGQMVLNHTANLFLCATWGFCLIPNLTSRIGRVERPAQDVQPERTVFYGSATPVRRGSKY